MEKLKGLAIELDMDHLAVDRGLRGLKDNLRTVNSEMKRNMSVFDRSDKSVKKYETSLMGLNKKLEVQKAAVAEAQKEYEKMVEQHGRGSKEAEKAARDYNNQAAALNNLERYIERTKNELAEFEKQQRIANSSWTKMGERLESYGGKLRGIGGQMQDVGSQMTNKITKPAIGVTAAVGGIVAAFGWKRLTSLDAAQAQLKGLGYSTKQVGRISDQVTNAIQDGMTTMAEGTAVAAGALAAGVKEGKELEKYIKLVGDAAVGSNRPVEEMAQIFNRVQGAGKMMTQELNQIEHGMPGFSQAMAKHLGVPPEEMRKMVTAGKVTSKDFLKVMESFAGGMASAYAESWDGMVANTKAYIGIIGENFLRGVFQDSKKSLADFIEMLKSPEVQRRAAEMGETARVAFNKMKDSIMGVVDWYMNLDEGQKKIVHSLGLLAVAG
ncbi:MAG TPA: tape measure protein, partial [Pseudogracilibacillus sp.]|nr:tape measure protein [Pseudogracilibacillus sp.]